MTSLALLCLALTLAPAAFAAETPEARVPRDSLLYVGQLTDVDRVHRAFTIETAAGPETFLCLEDAVVIGAGIELGFEALAVGQRVAVEAIQDGSSQLALTVEIVGPDGIAAPLDVPRPAAALTITAVDVDGGRLHVKSLGGPLFYHVTTDTRIERDGVPIGLADLSIGERVVIAADETRPGSWTARSVSVLVPEPTPADAPDRGAVS